MGYAAYMSSWPFRECVLSQLTLPVLGWERVPPPDEAACLRLGTRSLLLLPAATLWLALGMLATLHTLLLL